jgi:hypothetical protein
MTPAIGQATIFLPVLAMVALTAFAFLRLAIVRVRTARRREVKLSYYRAFQGPPEPEQAAATARHYNNLFEAPLLFYVGCVVAFELGTVTPLVLALAWGYVVARTIQSAIHLGSNDVRKRAYAFFAGWLFLAALWLRLAVSLFGQL